MPVGRLYLLPLFGNAISTEYYLIIYEGNKVSMNNIYEYYSGEIVGSIPGVGKRTLVSFFSVFKILIIFRDFA